MVFGSGPIRIGQGIEFDYAQRPLRVSRSSALGYEVVIVNNNPETVSTDFDTADRLYFEPLTRRRRYEYHQHRKAEGRCRRVRRPDGHQAYKDACEKQRADPRHTAPTASMRQRTESALKNCSKRCNIKRPKGHTVMTTEEALAAAHDLGYPVLMRPSYVLGGQNMIIAYGDDDINEYMAIILRQKHGEPGAHRQVPDVAPRSKSTPSATARTSSSRASWSTSSAPVSTPATASRSTRHRTSTTSISAKIVDYDRECSATELQRHRPGQHPVHHL